MKKCLWPAMALFVFALVPAARSGEPTTRPATQPATQPAQTLTAEQMLSQLLRPRATPGRPLAPTTGPAAYDKTSGRGAVAPGAPVVSVLREGTFIVDRVGRLTRTTDGSQAEFTFEADGKALKDPPMLILPNLKLVVMENVAGPDSRDLRFRVTGMVTEYHGRNYLLLEKVVVVPDVLQQF